MKALIGENISRFRRRKGLTQEELASKVGVTYQAVSKWENGISAPDISLIPKIACILNISIDSLMGYTHNFSSDSYYEDEYKKDKYFWGIEPSKMCLRILELMPPVKKLKLLDIGCGEGKDAVFMAKCGYNVTAFDISDSGIEKTKRLAELSRVNINAFTGDLFEIRLSENFDIIYSSGILHCIQPEMRYEIISNYKAHTNHGGLNAFHVFVGKPFIAPPPEKEVSFLWKSGEIFTMYHDWLFENCDEVIFDCNSSGIPHRHAANILLVRNI